MKIIYLHQYFNTPSQPGGTRSYWFAKALVGKGVDVKMITSDKTGNRKRLVSTDKIDDIDVCYINNRYDNSMGVLRRLLSFLRFSFLSLFVVLREKNVDMIYATSTPLTVGIPALFSKWFKKTPYIFEVRDLWPEVPIQMGGLKNGLLKRIAKWGEKTIYRNAEHVVVLSPGMMEGVLSTGIPKEKVSLIPNMSKIDQFWKRHPNPEIAERFGIDLNKFNVIHFGAMGIANGLDYIINAAEILKDDKDIAFIFVGNGAVKQQLKKSVEIKELKNVKIIDAQPMDIVSEIVNLCNVSIVPFQNIPILRTNSPNKLFDSLSAQIPIVVNSAGWTKKLVEENNCGAYVDPEKPEEFAELLISWKSNPNYLKSMGESARELAEKTYDKSILCEKLTVLILKHLNY